MGIVSYLERLRMVLARRIGRRSDFYDEYFGSRARFRGLKSMDLWRSEGGFITSCLAARICNYNT